jgi:hypothetical protein
MQRSSEIVFLGLAALLRVLLDAVDREVLPPRGEQHDLREAVAEIGPTLCGSSRMTRSPRSPVPLPPVEVANLKPLFGVAASW